MKMKKFNAFSKVNKLKLNTRTELKSLKSVKFNQYLLKIVMFYHKLLPVH